MAHYCGFQLAMHPLHHSIALRMVRRGANVFSADELDNVLKHMGLELLSLVRGDGLWATESGYPARHEGADAGLRRDVYQRIRLRPSRKSVDGSEAVSVSRRIWQRAD